MERFYDKISPEPNTGCWLWCGSYFKSGGYPRFAKTHDKSVLAHRHMWEMERGPIPDGLFVCHRCDNPGCVNPSHMFLGTAAENMTDKVAKGRQTRGSGIRPTPITANLAREIVASGEAAAVIAKRIGVVAGTVHNIRAGRTWSHATGVKL